jgi:hypothetical protein
MRTEGAETREKRAMSPRSYGHPPTPRTGVSDPYTLWAKELAHVPEDASTFEPAARTAVLSVRVSLADDPLSSELRRAHELATGAVGCPPRL